MAPRWPEQIRQTKNSAILKHLRRDHRRPNLRNVPDSFSFPTRVGFLRQVRSSVLRPPKNLPGPAGPEFALSAFLHRLDGESWDMATDGAIPPSGKNVPKPAFFAMFRIG